MFKIERGKSKTLIEIAYEFYSKVNPMKKGKLENSSLKKRLVKKITKETDLKKKYFYETLYSNDFELLNQIITGNPEQLNLIQENIEKMVTSNTILPFSQTIKGKLSSTDFGTEVLKLFNYKNWRGGSKFKWLSNELDIIVCPYCNNSQTIMVNNTNGSIILYEFDHFIPKVIAPYLSLSFFNLIPSCHTCNAVLKKEINFNLNDFAHPYYHNLHSWIRFSTDNLPPVETFPLSADIGFALCKSAALTSSIDADG